MLDLIFVSGFKLLAGLLVFAFRFGPLVVCGLLLVVFKW